MLFARVVVLVHMTARFLLLSNAPWVKLGLVKLSIYGKGFYEALSLHPCNISHRSQVSLISRYLCPNMDDEDS